MIERPLQALFPLEVQASTVECLDQEEKLHEAEQTVPTRSARTRRTAAIIADEKTKVIDQFL